MDQSISLIPMVIIYNARGKGKADDKLITLYFQSAEYYFSTTEFSKKYQFS